METYYRNIARRRALTQLYTALVPVPLSSFLGEGTSQMGKAFIKSYVGVCLEGADRIIKEILGT